MGSAGRNVVGGSRGGNSAPLLQRALRHHKLASEMDTLSEIQALLDASEDRDNPSPEALVDLLHEVRRIAVIGMSRNPEKAARRVPSYLAARGFDVVPVNPHAERMLGRTVYPTLEEVPGEVDLVVVFRPSEVAGPFVTAAKERPEKPAIWLQTGIRSDEEAQRARADGYFVVQDLCIFRVHRKLVT